MILSDRAQRMSRSLLILVRREPARPIIPNLLPGMAVVESWNYHAEVQMFLVGQARQCRRQLPTVRFYFNCAHLAALPRTAAEGPGGDIAEISPPPSAHTGNQRSFDLELLAGRAEILILLRPRRCRRQAPS